jgi:hypothetical protein
MARVIETAILNAVEGKTRAQQVARIKEWKKHWLADGADKVVVKELGSGNINGQWIFEIHHKSAATYGSLIDTYYKNPKSFDDIVAKWQKTPTLNIVNFAVAFEVEDI